MRNTKFGAKFGAKFGTDFGCFPRNLGCVACDAGWCMRPELAPVRQLSPCLRCSFPHCAMQVSAWHPLNCYSFALRHLRRERKGRGAGACRICTYVAIFGEIRVAVRNTRVGRNLGTSPQFGYKITAKSQGVPHMQKARSNSHCARLDNQA